MIKNIDFTIYNKKDFIRATAFMLVTIVMAILITNMVFFYNMYETSNNFFNLAFMDRHPLSYFAYGTLLWFALTYFYAHANKHIDDKLCRVSLIFAFGLYFIISFVFFFYYLANYNISFLTYTYFNSIFVTLGDNLAYLFINFGLLVCFFVDYKLVTRNRVAKATTAPSISKADKSHKSWLFIVLIVILSMLILNEMIAFLTSSILDTTYHIFPYSIGSEYDAIQAGNGLAVVFSMLLIFSVIVVLIGVALRHFITKLFMVIPVTVFFGSMVSNIIYYMMVQGGDLSFSPLYMFQLYFSDNVDPFCYKVSVAVGFFIGLCFAIICLRGMFNSTKKVHGNAKFANYIDIWRYGMFKHSDGALSLGNWNGSRLWLQGFAPVMVLANVGGGKSTALAIPATVQWNGSGIHNDTANELYETTANYLRSQGNAVFQFRPMSRQTHRFNPFHWCCAMDLADRWGVIERICLKIIPQSKGESSKSWSSMARRVLEGLSSYLISTTGYCTLGQLAEICCKGNFTEWLKKEVIENDHADAQFKVNALAFINIEAEQTQGGVKFNYEAYIGLYLNPIIRAATEYSDFDVTRLRKEKMHIFFGIPDGEISQLEPLIAMFWEEISAHLMKKVPNLKEEPYPVLFNIDEFGNSGRLDRIRKNLTTLRKYRVRTIIYLQYKRQVGQDFTAEESEAFDSIPNKILLSATGSINDAKYLSELFGQKTIRYNTKNRQGMRVGVNTNENIHKQALITADELMHLKDSDGLAHVAGKNPIRFKKSYYFKDRNLMKLLGQKIDSDNDDCVPMQTPIEPIIDISMMKKELTDEEKEIKRMENQAKQDLKHEQELDKIREMTSMVLESVERANNPKNEQEDCSLDDSIKRDM